MKSNEGRQATQGGYEGLFLYKMKTFWSVGEGSKGRKQGKESSQGRHDCLFLYLNENVFGLKGTKDPSKGRKASKPRNT